MLIPNAITIWQRSQFCTQSVSVSSYGLNVRQKVKTQPEIFKVVNDCHTVNELSQVYC